jgi:DNA polymerase-4
VGRLWGAGKKTVPRLQALGLHTIGDVAAADERWLVSRLGAAGRHFRALALARDPRKVQRSRGAKSIGSERTLSKDVTRRDEIEVHLRRAAERIARRVRAKGYVASGVRVRLKTNRFEMLTRQRHLTRPADTEEAFLAVARRLLDELDHPGPFRLVGMAVFELDHRQQPLQTDLFEVASKRRLETTVDDLITRFGKGTLMRARDLNDPGTVSRDGVNLDFLS